MESTAGAIGDVRLVGGLGYRPFDMSGDDVANMVRNADLQEGDALIFRRQLRLPGTLRQGGPIQEALHLGVYHEQIVAVTQDGYYTTELFSDEGVRSQSRVLSLEAREDGVTAESFFRASFGKAPGKFQFVGRTTNFDTLNGFSHINPRDYAVEGEFEKPAAPTTLLGKVWNKIKPWNEATGYNLFTNNCQYHAYAVRQELGVR